MPGPDESTWFCLHFTFTRSEWRGMTQGMPGRRWDARVPKNIRAFIRSTLTLFWGMPQKFESVRSLTQMVKRTTGWIHVDSFKDRPKDGSRACYVGSHLYTRWRCEQSCGFCRLVQANREVIFPENQTFICFREKLVTWGSMNLEISIP